MSSSDHAKAVAEAMTALWKGELPATVRVISAVRDETRDYRPHERSRSAWELAVHIATADLWFISCIERGAFNFDPEAAKQAEARFSQVKDVVAFYEAMIPAGLQRLEAMSGDQLAEPLARVPDIYGPSGDAAVPEALA